MLIVGGGIAGIEALMALADLGDNRLRLRVIAAQPRFVLRPQILGEPWGGDPLHIDLERLCRAFGAQFTLATVTSVDAAAHHVELAGGPTVSYERLLLTPGAQLTLPYQSTRVLGFGALPHALASAGSGSVAIVVPAATSWTLPAYELALLCAGEGRDVRVVTAEAEPMEAFGPATVPATTAMLRDHGIAVEPGQTPPLGSDVSGLADTVVALPLLEGPAIGGLPAAFHAFIAVDRRMAVRGLADVHAAGDATDGPIKQGGLARPAGRYRGHRDRQLLRRGRAVGCLRADPARQAERSRRRTALPAPRPRRCRSGTDVRRAALGAAEHRLRVATGALAVPAPRRPRGVHPRPRGQAHGRERLSATRRPAA